ncbi:hypothetical protein, partial [Mycobacterium montefiorense]|uniref:hypothetical protein n=1 Tax=Mycobacterium montefiorense TaxID=154654 RepID=UPI0022327C32
MLSITVVRVSRRCPRPSRYAAIHAGYRRLNHGWDALDSYRLSILSGTVLDERGGFSASCNQVLLHIDKTKDYCDDR